jgi:hypothetical protein
MTRPVSLPIDCPHPRPALDRAAQWAAVLAAGTVAVAGAALAVLGVAAGAPLFAAAGVLLALGFTPVVLLPTVRAPAVTLTEAGLVIRPRIFPAHTLAWGDVRAVHDDPFLTPASAEGLRRIAQGRRHYAPARGVLVVSAALPVRYRILGVLGGLGWVGAFSIGTRTHQRADEAMAVLRARVPG